jgi:glutaredoxin
MLKRIAQLLGWSSKPPPEYSSATRAALDQWTSTLRLYHFYSCPFCARVHRALRELGLNPQLCEVTANTEHRKDLVNGGGRTTVPCLRIAQTGAEDIWMYESTDIVAWLRREVASICARPN